MGIILKKQNRSESLWEYTNNKFLFFKIYFDVFDKFQNKFLIKKIYFFSMKEEPILFCVWL